MPSCQAGWLAGELPASLPASLTVYPYLRRFISSSVRRKNEPEGTIAAVEARFSGVAKLTKQLEAMRTDLID